MHYLDSLYAQPDNLARSRDTVAAALSNLRLPATHPQVRTVFAGMGASLFACRPVVDTLRTAGQCACAVLATDAARVDPTVLGDVAVLVSQSGRSTETAEAAVRSHGLPTVGLCNDADSPVAQRVEMHLPLGSAADPPVATLTYTATLQALGLLAEHLGSPATTDWEGLPRLAQQTLEDSAATALEVAAQWQATTAIDVVASAGGMASAEATALLVREAVRIPATATDTYQFLHGPVEVAEPGRVFVIFGAGREISLAEALAGYGAHVLLVTTDHVEPAERLTVVRLPQMGPLALPVLQILPAQLLVWHLAQQRGLAIDGFRHHQDDTKLEVA